MGCKLFSIIVLFIIFGIILIGLVNAADISNCDQLQAMGLTGTYSLTQNIDCSGRNFQPIGSITNPFTGTLNGNRKIITGLSENNGCGGGCGLGLFGKIQNANVNNVGLRGVDIVSTGSPSVYIGALAGISIGSIISGCFATGSVSVSSGVPYTSEAGGLIGLSSTSTISNSYSQVNIASGSGNWVGGFTGFSSQSTISNCYSTGLVPHSKAWGGFIGYSGGGNTINNCYWDTQTSEASTSAGGTGLTTADMKIKTTFTNAGWTSPPWNLKDGDYPGLGYDAVSPAYWTCSGTAGYQTVLNHQCGPPIGYPTYAAWDYRASPPAVYQDNNHCYFSSDGSVQTVITGGSNWWGSGDLGSKKCVQGINLSDISPTNSHNVDVYLSDDGVNWGSPVASNLHLVHSQVYTFTETPARYVKVVMHDCSIGNCWLDEYQPLTRSYICVPDSEGNGCSGTCVPSCSGEKPYCNAGVCVQCIDKTNCGTDQFTGIPYCKSGDVSNIYSNKIEYSCLNYICSNSINERISKVCDTNEECLNGICVLNYVSNVDWTDMVNKPITDADLNDRVKLLATGIGLNGKNFDFTIYKKSFPFDSEVIQIKNVIGQGNNYAYATWRPTQQGDYYYKLETFDGIHSSGILHVSNAETNSKPNATITNPKKGDIKNIGELVAFNQSSYDVDDFMNYSWNLNLDDSIIFKGSTRDYVNYNLSYSYSSPGQKNINLSVIDERGLTDQDYVSILIINPSAVGNKYVFAGISKPRYKQILTMIGNVEFDASDSFVIQVGAGGLLTCLGGACPAGVTPTANSGKYDMFNFSWRFDDGSESGKISGNTKYSKGFLLGDHFAKLEVSLNTGEKGNTIVIFKYLGGGSDKCQEGKTLWVENGIGYNTLEANGKCRGENPIIASDDCCPDGQTCQGTILNAKCILSADCIPVPHCSNYTDSSSCIADKCGAAQKGCTSSSSRGDICTGVSSPGGTVGGACNCFWNGTECKLNTTTSINIGDMNIIGTGLIDSISYGECTEGQMVVTQHCTKSWDYSFDFPLYLSTKLGYPGSPESWLDANCQMSDCFTGTRMMACDDNGIRLGFFNWFNALIAMIVIAIVYFILIKSDKKKN